MTTAKAIQEFYADNGFADDGGETSSYVWIKFGFFSIPIPNADSRRKNVYLHDVSHIVTGYDTSWKGESAVSAWEIASGGWQKLYIPWLLTLWAMGLGVLFYPSVVFQAFQKGLTMRNALTCGLSKDELMQLPVSDLRTRLSTASKSSKKAMVWMLLAVAIFLLPFILGILIVLGVLTLL